MASYSKIEWTDASWNPIIGCTQISPGCENCYAKTLSERFRGVKGHPFEMGFDLRIINEKFEDPLKWKKPRKVFVCSMSDLFHEDIPLATIKEIFDVICKADRHIFQVLTKRSKRIAEIADNLPWPKNLWLGVSIESSDYTFRAHDLSKVPASTRFLSLEPLLGPIHDLPLQKVDWVIVGGESGVKARPMDLNWAREIRDLCKKSEVPYFLKQLGGRKSKRGGEQAILDGQLWHQFPKIAQQNFASTSI